MRVRSPFLTLLAASLLVFGVTACGDDDTDGASNEPASAEAAGDPTDPCTLLTAADFESALGVSIGEPEDVSDRFTIGGPDVDSPACQWEATTEGDGAAVSVYTVQLITVPDDVDGEVYADMIEIAERFDDQVSDLDLGDEAVTVDDGDSPKILVRRGEVLLELSTASDDLSVDELFPLVEAAVGRIDAG